MSKFSISPSSRCQYLDNILGIKLADPGNHCEYSRCSLLMSRYASCLWSLVLARVSCGCSLGASLHALWIHPISVVLSPMDRRHSSSSSVYSTISIHIYNSSAQKSNRLICASPQYSLDIFHLHSLPFDMKPPIPILQASVRQMRVGSQ